MTAVVNPKGILTLTYPTVAKDGQGNDVPLPRSDIADVEVRVDDGPNQAEYEVPATGSASDDYDISAQLKTLAPGAHTVSAAVKTQEGIVGTFSAEFQIIEAPTPAAPTISLS